MKESRMELKVGFFVAVGLVLLALLVLSFSRGLTLFSHTYHMSIKLDSAAGLKPTADVMMAGVPIGKATGLELSPDGHSVVVKVGILSKYRIRTNAVFQIDALGFLGDQYISVTPSTNLDAGFWEDGGVALGRSPFNMQEAVRSVAGLLDQARKMVTDIDAAINNVNRTVLSEETLSNVSLTLSNVEAMALLARHMAQGADDLIHSNTPSVNAAVADLRSFSDKLNLLAGDLEHMVASNQPAVNQTIQNLRDTSASIKQVSADLEAGKGLAGGLLADPGMKTEGAELISNANAMAAAFSDFGSNLNRRGIWSMMWKPKHVERSETNSSEARGGAGK